MNNLFDFLNYKQEIVKLKIHEKKTKLKEFKQKGGTEIKEQIAQLETEIIKLMAINTILSNQQAKVSKLNLDEILENLTRITSKYNDLIKQAPPDFELKDSLYTNRILNLMQSLETQLDGTGTDFLNIRLNNKLTFVQPPIDITSIDRMNLDFVTALEDNIQKFITAYTKKSSESESTFGTEKTGLLAQSEELDKKIASLNRFGDEIRVRLNEIESYTNVTYKLEDLKPTFFFKPNDTIPASLVETITINQLVGLEFGSTASIDEASLNISKLGSLENIDKLINPVFSSQASVFAQPTQNVRRLIQQEQLGGFSLFASISKKEEKITNELITKWEKELVKSKGKLCKKHYEISTANVKQANIKKLSQTGGAFKNWEEYYSALISYQQKVGEYKSIYNELVNVSNQFNLAYLQFFYHKLFIVNYVKLTLTKPAYRVYSNISRGSVSYYLSIISDILTKFSNPEIVKTNSTYNYFYTYHLLNLRILNGFLGWLHLNWKAAPEDEQIESNKNVSRLYVLNSTVNHAPNIKKGFFLFNLFKDILDDFKLTQSSPVSVFLRINDRPELPVTAIGKKEVNFIKSSREQLQTAPLNTCLTRMGQTENKEQILSKFDTRGGIKFNEIFDPEGFKNNDTLALYMGIPNYLSKSQSIMMITYGYSGVGKTFTLFGNKGTQSGVLQKALTSIQDMKAIYTRSYEIYGLALPYKSYWSGRDPSQYSHKIYTYRIKKLSGNMIGVEHTPSDIKSGSAIKLYLDDVKSDIEDSNQGTYTKIDTMEITNFSEFVDKIDEIRIAEGRIKKTVNNPVSSRSIMVYEFKVKLNSNKVVRFVVMDLPGKEDILNSYVKPDPMIHNQYCIQLKQEFSSYDQTALRAAVYLNPMLLAVFPNVAIKLNTFLLSKLEDVMKQAYLNFLVTTVGPSVLVPDGKKLLGSKKIIDLINWNKINESEIYEELKRYFGRNAQKMPYGELVHNFRDIFKSKKIAERTQLENDINDKIRQGISLGIIFREKNYTVQDKVNFKTCILAGENLRFILENNLINLLTDFYSTNLINLDATNCTIGKNTSAISFEGFYINENILGLVNTLSKRLNRGCSVQKPNPIPSMGNYFSNQMDNYNSSLGSDDKRNIVEIDPELLPVNTRLSSVPQSLYKLEYSNNLNPSVKNEHPGNETRSQTYFLRDFLRNDINLNDSNVIGYFENDNVLLSSGFNGYATPKYLNKSIKSWFEDSYDFNKTYADEPPIATFMEAYFGKEEDDVTDVINNFYLFYVVSNDNKEKCANQIKLISDSEIFIKTIKEWTPCA